MNELDLQYKYGQMYDVSKELENWLVSDCDYADTPLHNYKEFLEHTTNLGYMMPVDKDPYFDFWNSVYQIIENTIKKYHESVLPSV